MSETFLRTVFPRLLDGLELIHARDLLHLDIKPGNIHIRRGGQPLLLDFGAVHGFPQSRQEQPGQVISPGSGWRVTWRAKKRAGSFSLEA